MHAVINWIKYVVLLGVVPYLNFYYWRQYGRQTVLDRREPHVCPLADENTRANSNLPMAKVDAEETLILKSKRRCKPAVPAAQRCSPIIQNASVGRISKVDSKTFGEYKGKHLIQLKSPAIATTVVDVSTEQSPLQPNLEKV